MLPESLAQLGDESGVFEIPLEHVEDCFRRLLTPRGVEGEAPVDAPSSSGGTSTSTPASERKSEHSRS